MLLSYKGDNFLVSIFFQVSMKLIYVIVAALVLVHVVYCEDDEDKKPKKLQIGVKKRAEECKKRSKKGDTLIMQYRVNTSKTLRLNK